MAVAFEPTVESPRAACLERCGPSRLPSAAPAWRLVGQFATLESAQAAAERLRLRGVVTSVSMVGGLSVIARA